MKKYFTILASLAAISLVLAGCEKNDDIVPAKPKADAQPADQLRFTMGTYRFMIQDSNGVVILDRQKVTAHALVLKIDSTSVEMNSKAQSPETTDAFGRRDFKFEVPSGKTFKLGDVAGGLIQFIATTADAKQFQKTFAYNVTAAYGMSFEPALMDSSGLHWVNGNIFILPAIEDIVLEPTSNARLDRQEALKSLSADPVVISTIMMGGW